MAAHPVSRQPFAQAGVKIGCCGFAGSQASYFEQFQLVEVQQTFYEPPRLSTAQRWRGLAPADFEFTLKAWQIITHEATSPTYRRLRTPLNDKSSQAVGSFKPTEEVRAAWMRTREIALALRARAIVFQCPASFQPTPDNTENLRQFFKAVRRETRRGDERFVFAWEPRGPWPEATIAELCKDLDLVHAVDPFVRRPVTRDGFYFRLHGLGGYRHRYSDAELRRLAEWVQGFPGGYCLFNNLSMREDAQRFARLLATN
jgi:uncharacterized protein YecE (DUF72 family)